MQGPGSRTCTSYVPDSEPVGRSIVRVPRPRGTNSDRCRASWAESEGGATKHQFRRRVRGHRMMAASRRGSATLVGARGRRGFDLDRPRQARVPLGSQPMVAEVRHPPGEYRGPDRDGNPVLLHIYAVRLGHAAHRQGPAAHKVRSGRPELLGAARAARPASRFSHQPVLGRPSCR